MVRTVTRYIDFSTLQRRGASALPVIRLMMACNDMQLANEALKNWGADGAASRDRQRGATMYFVRLQWAHLHEGLKAIRSIADDPVLRMTVDQCDERTRESFQYLVNFAPGGPKEADFYKKSGMIRDNVAFHYNDHQGKNSGKLIRKAIDRGADQVDGRRSSITRGDNPYDWHFKVADDIIDSIVVREIWKISHGAATSSEANAIMGEIFDVFLRFMDFSGEFIWRYCEY